MIFVTIGTMYGFSRLIKEMDKIAGQIEEEVIMQIGETKYEPVNTKYFRYASREEMNEIYKNSRIVVCHAGIGSIISALEYKKSIIVVPRSKEYEEAIDDHQFEITRELEKEGMINAIFDIRQLNNVLMNKISDNNEKNHNNDGNRNTELIKSLKEYINQINERCR